MDVTQALQGIHQRHAKWWPYESNTHHYYAATPVAVDPGGSGCTVDADTVDGLEQQIAAVEAEQEWVIA